MVVKIFSEAKCPALLNTPASNLLGTGPTSAGGRCAGVLKLNEAVISDECPMPIMQSVQTYY